MNGFTIKCAACGLWNASIRHFQDPALAPNHACSTCRLPATQCRVTCGDIWSGTRLVILALTLQSRDRTHSNFENLRRRALYWLVHFVQMC